MKNEKQFRNILILIVLFLSVLSCTNPVEIATETMHQNIDSVLSDDINFLIATTPFMCYNANENYWYTDDVTYREMIDDKYKHGLKGLAKLQKRVGYIEDYALTQDIFDASVKLKNEIKKDKKRIKEGMHAMRQLDFMFGDMGGFGTMLNFGEALDSDYDTDKEFIPLAENVQKAKENLYNLILAYKSTFQDNIETFCFNSIDSISFNKLKDEQLRVIVDSAYSITLHAFYNNKLDYNDYECLNMVSEYFFEQ